MAKGNSEVWPHRREWKVGIGRCVSQGRASLLPQACLIPAGLAGGDHMRQGGRRARPMAEHLNRVFVMHRPCAAWAPRLVDQAPGCAASPGAHLAQGALQYQPRGAQLCRFGHPAPLTCPQGGLQRSFPDSPRCQHDPAVCHQPHAHSLSRTTKQGHGAQARSQGARSSARAWLCLRFFFPTWHGNAAVLIVQPVRVSVASDGSSSDSRLNSD